MCFFKIDTSIHTANTSFVNHTLELNVSKSIKLIKVPILRPLLCNEFMHLEIGNKAEKLEENKTNYLIYVNPKTSLKPGNIKMSFPPNMKMEDFTIKEFPFEYQFIYDSSIPFNLSFKLNITSHMKSLSILHPVSDKPNVSFTYFVPLPNEIENQILQLAEGKINHQTSVQRAKTFILDTFNNLKVIFYFYFFYFFFFKFFLNSKINRKKIIPVHICIFNC